LSEYIHLYLVLGSNIKGEKRIRKLRQELPSTIVRKEKAKIGKEYWNEKLRKKSNKGIF